MPAPICGTCARFMRPLENDVVWEDVHAGELRAADYWGCGTCGQSIVIGHAQRPLEDPTEEDRRRVRFRVEG